MIQKILPLLNRLIPSQIARKGLEKKLPHLSNYFGGMAAAGYGLDTALDFLRDQATPIDEPNLRLDEQAAKREVKQGELLGNTLGALGKGAIGAGAAGAAVTALPSVIGNLFGGEKPEEPQQKKSSSPLSRDSLRDQFEEAQNNRSLSDLDPKIASEIDFDVSNGLTLDDAIENIKGQPQIYGKSISNLERNLRMPFREIVKQFYKGQKGQMGQNASPPSAPSAQGGNKTAILQTMQQITDALRQMRGNG